VSQSLPRALARLAADQIENHVDVGDLLLETLRGVIDGRVRAEGQRVK
jgi:hypothetical protein